MAKKVYESMFIFSANAYARNPGNASNGIKDIVDSVGGELLASRMWNEQKLAYPINGQRKGVYWLSYIRMDGEALPQFNRACKLNDMIMRHLVVSVDPRLEETLVAAANTTGSKATSTTANDTTDDTTETDDDDDASEENKEEESAITE